MMFYEECVRVPLCLSWRGGIPEGITNEQHLASGVHLLPTICDYAGLAPGVRLPGVSLRSTVESRDTGRDYVVAELTALRNLTDDRWQGRMLRTHGHKYILIDGGERRELLSDLARDPLEMADLDATTMIAAGSCLPPAVVSARCVDEGQIGPRADRRWRGRRPFRVDARARAGPIEARTD
jgi:arylsulfatase A-like enzyme